MESFWEEQAMNMNPSQFHQLLRSSQPLGKVLIWVRMKEYIFQTFWNAIWCPISMSARILGKFHVKCSK